MGEDLLTEDEIRDIYLANGFTIKEGQTDLKDYVYMAARAIEHLTIEKMRNKQDEELHKCFSEVVKNA